MYILISSARNGYPRTRVATRYPGTQSGPGYPVIFITRSLCDGRNGHNN